MKKLKVNKANKGISLVEILIVIAIFAVLAVITTRSIVITLKGARKSDSQIKVRENLNYAVSVMERQIRSAQEISPCPNSNHSTISYLSLEGISSSFNCGSGYISSGSARLTSTDVSIDSCSMVCEKESENYPSKVSISISASDANLSGTDKGSVIIETEIVGRNY